MLSPHAGRQRGVTLIELAVALSVFGLTLAALLPEVGAWMTTMRIRSAADALQNGLQTARMEALRRNASVRFELVSASGGRLTDACAAASTSASWVVSLDAPDGACSAAPSPTPTAKPRLLAKYAASDAAKVSVKADGSHVVFNAFGQVDAANTDLSTVALSLSSGRSLQIQVNGGGRIRLCDPNVADSDSRSCNH